jgi:hypothetical protein
MGLSFLDDDLATDEEDVVIAGGDSLDDVGVRGSVGALPPVPGGRG